jgi:hypothetical protein
MTSTTPVLSADNFIDESIHERFTRRAGIFYGALVALGFTLVLWLPDALALRDAFVLVWWGKLALGLALTLPLGLLIGWLAASTRRSGVTVGLWIIGVALMVLIAGHLPYEGLGWLWGLTDPYPNAQAMFPFSIPTATVTGLCLLAGAGVGLFIGLLSLPAIHNAWDRSTRSHRLSLSSIFRLILGALPIVLLVPIVDIYLVAPLRMPLIETQAAIQTALKPDTNLDALHLPFLKSVRSQLTTRYTLYWVTSSDDTQQTAVDVLFDSGFLLRCNYNFGAVGFCQPLDQNLRDGLMQLMTTGHLTCTGCGMQTDRAVRQYLAVLLPELHSAKLVETSLLKHHSGWIYERARFDNGRTFDCRFSGQSPIVVDLCLEVK